MWTSEVRGPRACLLAWLALAVGCAGPAAPPREIVVGVSLPLTGADASAGEAMRAGYARAADETNAAGGVALLGTGTRLPVKLVVLDDRGETPRAEEQAAALIRSGAHLLLATHTGVRATAQAAVAEHAGRPYFVNSTDAAGLPGRRMSWVFSVAVLGTDLESRALETGRLALATLARAPAVDAAHVRIAFNGM
jgi:branched-chain amino acid transport system substrate-binding protein